MKQDYFSINNIIYIDYKDVDILKKFLNPVSMKILPRKKTGMTMKNQRALARAVKISRYFGFLPYVGR